MRSIPRATIGPVVDRDLRAGFDGVRLDAGLPDEFPAEVEQAAAALASTTSNDASSPERVDHRDIEFWTIDPIGSRDLDQALHLERRSSGFRLRYAIADVGAWIDIETPDPGNPIDIEARRRGVTVYCPDRRVPLHPTVLSEGAASLLPGLDRPAVLWVIDFDDRGETVNVEVSRALVRSRRQTDYDAVQRVVDSGNGDHQSQLLAEVGNLLMEREADRGGVSLRLPEQETIVDDAGGYQLVTRRPVSAESWNAQLSLATGRAAAALMLDHGWGLLRTVPPAPDEALNALRSASLAAGVPWPVDLAYGAWVRSLDVSEPHHMALMVSASRLLRGSGYLALTGGPPPDAASTIHAAIAAPYAHVTAPLRRLADRFATEAVLAGVVGQQPTDQLAEALEALPQTMGALVRRAAGVERQCVDLIEAAILGHRIGDTFNAVITAVDRSGRATLVLTEPAVIASLDGVDAAAAGTAISVLLTAVDHEQGRLTFRRA